MVIQARLETKGDALQADIDSLRALNTIVSEAGQKVLGQFESKVFADMRRYPPPAKHPFDFGSEEARDDYMAKVKSGQVRTSGKRYVRTGALAASMFFLGQSGKGRFTFKAGTRSKIAKLVVGSFDTSRDYRIPGHVNTGWPVLRNSVVYWMRLVNESMEQEISSIYVTYRSSRKNR